MQKLTTDADIRSNPSVLWFVIEMYTFYKQYVTVNEIFVYVFLLFFVYMHVQL